MSRIGELLGARPWPAPAKLNLCLHIVGRRADGYHLLQIGDAVHRSVR